MYRSQNFGYPKRKEKNMNKKAKLILSILVFALILSAATVFSATAAEGEVIYVADSGRDGNNGLTPDKPKGSLGAAISALSKTGGTIVLTGKTTISTASDGDLPLNEKKITVTSVYDGVNYTSEGSAGLYVNKDLFIAGELLFENLYIACTGSPSIYCQGNSVTFGDNIVTKTLIGSSIAIMGGTDATLKGATVENCSFKNFTVQINSGTWLYASLGNKRSAMGDPCGFIGDCSLIINGGTFTARGSSTTDSNLVCLTKDCGLDGYAKLIINGGEINSAIYGVGKNQHNDTNTQPGIDGEIYFEINGGTIRAPRIAPIQNSVRHQLDGNFHCKITAPLSSFPALTRISGEAVNGIATADITDDSLKELLYDFAYDIYVSESGNDKKDGKTEKNAVATLERAFALAEENGGRIVLLSSYTAKDTVIPASYKEITVSAKENISLTVEGTLTASSPLKFENITVKGDNAIISGGGYDLTVGENVKTEGTVFLEGGHGEGSHGVSVYSGDFMRIGGGTSEKGNVTAAIFGGSAKGIFGSSSGYTRGTASVMLFGGTVTEKVVASEYGAKGGAGIAVYGGKYDGATVEGDIIDTANIRFIADYGTGDGKTPFTPSSDIDAMFLELKETGGAVIIVGAYSQRELIQFSVYAKQTIDFGGKTGVLDFSPIFGSYLKLHSNIIFGGTTNIDSVLIEAMTNTAYLSANGMKLVIGNNVETSKDFGRAVRYYPSVFGGAAIEGSGYMGTRAGKLTVNSGTWQYAYGGNYIVKADASSIKLVSGDIFVEINGGRFIGGVAANGMNSLRGNASLVINGGEFDCSVYGGSEPSPIFGSSAIIGGNTTVEINAGIFTGNIASFARPDEMTQNGTFTLKLLGGDFSRVARIYGVEKCANYDTGKAKDLLELANNIDLEAKIEGTITYQNPIATFADPYMLYYNNMYYYVYADTYLGKPCVYMRAAANFSDINASTPVLVWAQATSGVDMVSLWAPTLFHLDGKLYLYATCAYEKEVEGKVQRRMPVVWTAKTDDPLDGFDYHGPFNNLDTDVLSYLSPRVTVYEGRLFLFTGGFWRDGDKIPGKKHYQSLFACELSDPMTFKTKMHIITQPTEDWEIDGEVRIVEGIASIYNAPDQKLYITYAAGQTQGNEYCQGLLRFDGASADEFLDRTKWHKFKTPLLSVNYSDRIYSPGAMTITVTPDGKTDVMLYHIKFYQYTGYTNRVFFASYLTYDENGAPKAVKAPAADTVFTYEINPISIGERLEKFEKTNTVAPAAIPAEEKDPEISLTDIKETVSKGAPELNGNGENGGDSTNTPTEPSGCGSYIASLMAPMLLISLALGTLLKKKED